MQVKAFSVIESVVTMILAAVIIGIVYVIFSILTARISDFKQQNESVADMNRLSCLIQGDISESCLMECHDSIIYFKDYAGKQTQYVCMANCIIRESATYRDTFHLIVKQHFTDTLRRSDQKFIFQRLGLKLQVDQQIYPLTFFRPLYPDQLIK